MSAPSTPLIAALDIGTSSVRAMLFDARGRPVPGAQASVATPLVTTAEGGAEVDPDGLVRAAVAALAAVEAQAGGRAAQVVAVAVCTFWHSLLGVGRGGSPLTPIYTWADARAAGVVPRLRRQFDERAVHARTGARFHGSYWPAKLAWLRQSQPRTFGRVERWMSPGEYLFLRLFGTPLSSISMASGTGLFDQNRLDWDGELLAALDVGREQLSPLVDLDAPASGVGEPFRSALPRLAQVPWLPALGDGACNSVGSGCMGRGRVALMVGTSGAMRLLFAAPEAQAPWGLWCYRADARRYLVGGAISNGGNLYAWMVDTLRLAKNPELEAALAALEPDGHGLTVLPFLAGERSPGYLPGATATISGLRWHTRPVEILRAGLEAVAYRLALIYELLRPLASPEAQIIASGAALVQSPVWTQIIADVLGRPVTITATPEATSRGAALLAAEALGLLPDSALVPVELGPAFEPDPARHERYLAGLARHRQLYRKLLGRGAF